MEFWPQYPNPEKVKLKQEWPCDAEVVAVGAGDGKRKAGIEWMDGSPLPQRVPAARGWGGGVGVGLSPYAATLPCYPVPGLRVQKLMSVEKRLVGRV